MSKLDWEKANKREKPKAADTQKNFIEYRADRYLAAVDKAQEDRRQRKRQKGDKR